MAIQSLNTHEQFLNIVTYLSPECLMFEAWGANANAGASIGEKKTRQECADACTASLTCMAADYDIITGQCYLHTSASNLRQRSTCCYRLEKLCNTQYSKCIHYLWYVYSAYDRIYTAKFISGDFILKTCVCMCVCVL